MALFWLCEQHSAAELLHYFNNVSPMSVRYVTNDKAQVVRFTLPESGVSYALTSLQVLSGRFTPGQFFPPGTTIAIHVLDQNAQPLALIDNIDLSDLPNGLAWREFSLDDVYVTDFFYAGIQPTGNELFTFGVAEDLPSGSNFGRSHIYVPSTGSLTAHGDDLMIAAVVGAVMPGIAGDYNQNGTVDAADYTLWRNTFGQTGVGLPADGDENGVVDDGDYGVWKLHFGQSAPGGNGGASFGRSAPEPGGITPAFVGAVVLVARRDRRKRQGEGK
jgi:hypothetical protein